MNVICGKQATFPNSLGVTISCFFIRVMSPRCSWHWLCHTHTESLRWSDVERFVCKWPANGVKRKRKCIFKHIFSSEDIYTLVYRRIRGCWSFSFFPKGLWDCAYITPAGSRGRNAIAGAECSKVLECAVGKYERGKRENEKEMRIRMKETPVTYVLG